MMTRLGYARIVWDTTPRRRHPIIRELLARAERAPDRHVVVRGSTRENIANLAAEAVEEWEAEYGGTTRGLEELDGVYLDGADGALIRQEWIDAHRREMPLRLARRVLAIDPAISMRRGTDATGMVEDGLGLDGQIYVIEDHSGHLPWEEWGELAVGLWLSRYLDCIVVERNRGGDAVVANLRACARQHRPPLDVEVLDQKAKTRHNPGVIYVKEVWARGSKDRRLEPCSPLYEKGRVSHVRGADLEELEEQITTWEPGEESPNAMDAHVWAMWELADLARTVKDGRRAMVGLGRVREALKASPRRSPTLGGLLPRNGGRSSRL